MKRRGMTSICLRPRSVVGVASVALALSAAACGSSSTTKSSRASGGKGIIAHLVAAGPTVSPPDMDEIGLTAGIQEGFCRQDGLDITEKQVAGSPLVVSALESGSVQIGLANTNVTAAADTNGGGLEIIAAESYEFPQEIVSSPSVTLAQQHWQQTRPRVSGRFHRRGQSVCLRRRGWSQYQGVASGGNGQSRELAAVPSLRARSTSRGLLFLRARRR